LNNSIQLLNDLILRATFPFTQQRPASFNAEILIEQSFSDFGDADAVVLLNKGTSQSCLIFIEAKVKSYQKRNWRIEDEFNQFISGIQNKENSSNLFAQLYYKYRLVRGLREGGKPALDHGVQFPEWSPRKWRKIGSNKVVISAVDLLKDNINQTFFLVMVPDKIDRVDTFFHSTFNRAEFEKIISWDLETFGYLTWAQIREFCESNSLTHTIDVFNFNNGQIY